MKKLILLLSVISGYHAGAQNWNLNGNAGTNSSTNYLGTSDNQPVVFKVNNTELMKLTPTGRIIFQQLDYGYGWNYNLFLGGGNETTTAKGNTVLGMGAFVSPTTGGGNTAVGMNSLRANTTGVGNTALGVNTFLNNESGNLNVGIGLNALNGLRSGDFNTAVGMGAMRGEDVGNIPLIGNNNTAVGMLAMEILNKGDYNTIIGSRSLYLMRNGSNNIALGYNIGFGYPYSPAAEINDANNNIFIGNNLVPKNVPLNNELNIGNWIIGNNGTIGIGEFVNQLPADGIAQDGEKYKLFVKDGIKTEKIKVDIAVDNGWADYVFKKDYPLLPLADVAAFISTNGHLPEVPTTEEVLKNGVELKEMNILLLKKIEELTLYSIEQQKRLDILEKEMKSKN